MAVSDTFGAWAVGAVLLGAGTALVYPTLIAAVGDGAHPSWRATAVGVYRLWRDAGYVAGALLGGVVADIFDLRAAVWAVAGLSIASGVVVAARMDGRESGRQWREGARPAVARRSVAAGRRSVTADPLPQRQVSP